MPASSVADGFLVSDFPSFLWVGNQAFALCRIHKGGVHIWHVIVINLFPVPQIGTTKGTGGDVLILEEAAYCDPNFFYETLAPILLLERTSLLAISTLTSEINFYSRLMKMKDSTTGRRWHPVLKNVVCVCLYMTELSFYNNSIFTILQIQLACPKCIEDGRSESCVHMLHLAPRWQSTERHRRLKTIMQDRPDLIQSELAGLAFDSLQQAFAAADVEVLFLSLSTAMISGFLTSFYFVCVL